MRPLDLIRDAGNMAEYARGFFPPDFGEWRHYGAELIVTLQIALWGTALADVLCSVPLSCWPPATSRLVGASARAPCARRLPLHQRDRLRAALRRRRGLGAFAGVLALWVHTTGILSKLFSEAVETIDPSPSRASAPPAPTRWPRSSSACCPRSCRCGSPTASTASSPTCARPPWSAWSARAASAWCCGT